jgi:hypothetical protein
MLKMTLKTVEDIRDESDYPGLHLSIETIFDKTKQILKVDVTTGDAITPKEVSYSFKLMFEDSEY